VNSQTGINITMCLTVGPRLKVRLRGVVRLKKSDSDYKSCTCCSHAKNLIARIEDTNYIEKHCFQRKSQTIKKSQCFQGKSKTTRESECFQGKSQTTIESPCFQGKSQTTIESPCFQGKSQINKKHTVFKEKVRLTS
jgi:stress-induced morphogen